MRAIRGIAVVGVTLVALAGIGTGTAFADPASTPSLTTLVGVGSDTITPLFDNGVPGGDAGSIIPDYNATNPTYKAASWDAVDPSTGAANGTITTKGSSSSDTACSMTRPDGSSAGITALNANQKDGSDYCVDFARSSRAPNAGSTDAFIPFAKDAIGWTYPVVSGETNHQPASLTFAQLEAIYTCADTTWGQVNGNSSDTTPIVPVLPQAGSGTRSTFLTALGISSSTVEPCWVNGTAQNGAVIEENTGDSSGNVAQFTQPSTIGGQSVPPADDIFPYSIGDWIAQSAKVTGTGTAGTPGGATVGGHAQSGVWDHGNLVQGEVSSQQPVTTNSYGQPVINPAWWPKLDRELYDVVRNGGTASAPAFPTTPAYEATGLSALFGPKGWLCTNNTAQSDIVSYGFSSLGSNCGTLTAGT